MAGYIEPPPTLEGLLWKRSPSALMMGSHQQRRVEIVTGSLQWFKPNSSGAGASGGRMSFLQEGRMSILKGNVKKKADDVEVSSAVADGGGSEKRGMLDFQKHNCIVEVVPDSNVKFVLKPAEGSWSEEGEFTGAGGDRIFHFDATDSEYPRSVWVQACKEHIHYAAKIVEQDVLVKLPVRTVPVKDEDVAQVEELLNRYIDARRTYNSGSIEQIFDHDAAVNGFFGGKLMLEKESRGTDFLLAFFDEEREAGTRNDDFQARITSVEVFGHIAVATLVHDNWNTEAKGAWMFDEIVHLMKFEEEWRIMSVLYKAKHKEGSGDDSLPDQVDLRQVRRLMTRYLCARRRYSWSDARKLFFKGGQAATMNGYFGRRLMLDSEGSGTPFLESFFMEESERKTDNRSFVGKISSLRVFGDTASATLYSQGWNTYDKGLWKFDEAFHIMKVEGQWQILDKIYQAVPDEVHPNFRNFREPVMSEDEHG